MDRVDVFDRLQLPDQLPINKQIQPEALVE